MVKVKTSKLYRDITELINNSVKALAKAEQICGSADVLAKKIGAGKKCYACWRSGTALLPLNVAMQIFVITRGKVNAHDLRPDLKPMIDQFHKIIIKKYGKSLPLITKKSTPR